MNRAFETCDELEQLQESERMRTIKQENLAALRSTRTGIARAHMYLGPTIRAANTNLERETRYALLTVESLLERALVLLDSQIDTQRRIRAPRRAPPK